MLLCDAGYEEIVLGSFNRATKTVGIIYYVFGEEVMVQGATRSSESGLLYLGKSITNHILFRRFINIFVNLIFKTRECSGSSGFNRKFVP